MPDIGTLLDLVASKDPVFFVSIGANDGVYTDPLHDHILRHGWHGVMVEPVPALFTQLCDNYKSMDGIEFECAAIGDEVGELPFFTVQHDEGPKWLTQLGSFDRSVILSHANLYPEIEKFIVEISVPCMTLQALLQRHSRSCMDVLAIDTEGHDYRILQQLDLEKCRPSIVIFEYKHLSDEDRLAAEDKFTKQKYALMTIGSDIIAVDPALYDRS